MKSISQQLEKIVLSNSIKDKNNLIKQQKYYERLKKEGIARKQTYNLKPVSAI